MVCVISLEEVEISPDTVPFSQVSTSDPAQCSETITDKKIDILSNLSS